MPGSKSVRQYHGVVKNFGGVLGGSSQDLDIVLLLLIP